MNAIHWVAIIALEVGLSTWAGIATGLIGEMVIGKRNGLLNALWPSFWTEGKGAGGKGR